MSTTALVNPAEQRVIARSGTGWFAAAFLCVAVTACLLAGWLPLGFSLVAVFLFAGPHNWMEARFFLTRMPSRWGRTARYYLLGIAGVAVLFVTSLLLPSVARNWQWQRGEWLVGIAAWNSLLVLWLMALIELRRRERKRNSWGDWAIPVGLAVIAVNWMWPLAWSLALIYLHPLVALWFLDRELSKRRGDWQRTYRRLLLLVPCLLAGLWWQLADSPNLSGDDLLSMQITHHAGGTILTDVSNHLLVATHVFLETLHYAAWIVAIPLAASVGKPWRIDRIPLVRKSFGWKTAVAAVLVIGAAITVCLWGGFLADYPLTRDIYFSVAILHVLAELPFLLRWMSP